jgi:hypothetical protein
MRMATKRKEKKTVRNSAVSGRKKPTRRVPVPVSAPAVLKKSSLTVAPHTSSFHAVPRTAGASPIPFAREIPTMYHETYIRIMPQNARHLFSFWEMAPAAIKKIKKTNPEYSQSSASMLRVFEVLQAGTPREEHRPAGDFPLEKGVGSRYISVPEPGRTYRAELGFRSPSGEFVSICGSRAVTFPPGRIQKGEAAPGGTTDTEALLRQSLRGTSLRAFDAGASPGGSVTGAIDPLLRSPCSSPVKLPPGPAAPDGSSASPS